MIPRVPKSAVGGLQWPAIPGRDATILFALLYQFEQSQWWPADLLKEHQFRQIQALLGHAGKTVPYYKALLERVKIDPNETLTPKAWARLPILTRRDVQENFPGLLSNNWPESHGKTSETLTSGSTGTPIKIIKTQLSSVYWRAITLRDHLWQRRNMELKLTAIKPAKSSRSAYPKGQQSQAWGTTTASTYGTGLASLLDIGTKVPDQVEWLQRQDHGYLLTYPSNLQALLKHCEQRKIRFPKLQQVMTMSELLQPEVRSLCQEVWGVPVADIYSTEEVGYVALQCPDHEHLHAQSEDVLVEVLNEDNLPCGPGEVGQVLVTPLHNFAMPLLRYAIGDFAEVGEACPCGRGLPVLNRILGRIRSMVNLPNGDQFYVNFQDLMKGLDQVHQFQIVRRAREELEVKLVARRPLNEAEEDKLCQVVCDRFKYPFRITISYHDEIPRSPGGKFQDYRSEID